MLRGMLIICHNPGLHIMLCVVVWTSTSELINQHVPPDRYRTQSWVKQGGSRISEVSWGLPSSYLCCHGNIKTRPQTSQEVCVIIGGRAQSATDKSAVERVQHQQAKYRRKRNISSDKSLFGIFESDYFHLFSTQLWLLGFSTLQNYRIVWLHTDQVCGCFSSKLTRLGRKTLLRSWQQRGQATRKGWTTCWSSEVGFIKHRSLLMQLVVFPWLFPPLKLNTEN